MDLGLIFSIFSTMSNRIGKLDGLLRNPKRRKV